MADCWDNITVGMKVEVENTDCDNFCEDFPDSFWVATVLRIAGMIVNEHLGSCLLIKLIQVHCLLLFSCSECI